jgi:hypothetical protein
MAIKSAKRLSHRSVVLTNALGTKLTCRDVRYTGASEKNSDIAKLNRIDPKRSFDRCFQSASANYWTTSSLTFAIPPPTIPSVSAAE